MIVFIFCSLKMIKIDNSQRKWHLVVKQSSDFIFFVFQKEMSNIEIGLLIM